MEDQNVRVNELKKSSTTNKIANSQGSIKELSSKKDKENLIERKIISTHKVFIVDGPWRPNFEFILDSIAKIEPSFKKRDFPFPKKSNLIIKLLKKREFQEMWLSFFEVIFDKKSNFKVFSDRYGFKIEPLQKRNSQLAKPIPKATVPNNNRSISINRSKTVKKDLNTSSNGNTKIKAKLVPITKVSPIKENVINDNSEIIVENKENNDNQAEVEKNQLKEKEELSGKQTEMIIINDETENNQKVVSIQNSIDKSTHEDNNSSINLLNSSYKDLENIQNEAPLKRINNLNFKSPDNSPERNSYSSKPKKSILKKSSKASLVNKDDNNFCLENSLKKSLQISNPQSRENSAGNSKRLTFSKNLMTEDPLYQDPLLHTTDPDIIMHERERSISRSQHIKERHPTPFKSEKYSDDSDTVEQIQESMKTLIPSSNQNESEKNMTVGRYSVETKPSKKVNHSPVTEQRNESKSIQKYLTHYYTISKKEAIKENDAKKSNNENEPTLNLSLYNK